MDKDDVYKKTQRLLKQLNYFILHVIVYFLSNIALVIMAFTDVGDRWWLFLIVFVWALVVIYHAFRVYGVDILSKKNKRMNAIWSYCLKLAGV